MQSSVLFANFESLMLRHAQASCALIDHTKLGLRSDYFFAKPCDFSTLVSDPAAKPFFKAQKKPLPFHLIL